MNIVAFAPRRLQQDGHWRSCELDQIRAAFAAELATGAATGWHVGATEMGDPQFYLIGPAPEENCILCISRLGRLYVLEDGVGQVVFEHTDLKRLSERARTFARDTRTGLIASFAVMWAAIRHSVEERIEPLLVESEELLVFLAPKLAALV